MWLGRQVATNIFPIATGAIIVIKFGLTLQRLAYNNTIKPKEAQLGREATHKFKSCTVDLWVEGPARG